MKNKAVIFGVNQYVGLSAARCLGEQGIHVVAVVMENHRYAEDYGFFSRYIQERVYVPHYELEEGRQGIVQRLIQFARLQEVKPVLIPSADPHVEIIDEYFDQLREHFFLPGLEQGLYTQLQDKDKLYLKCLEQNVLVPKVLIPDGSQNFLERVVREIGYPCLVKPVSSFEFIGVFRTKMFVVSNRQELTDGLQKAREASLDVFVQQMIMGFDDHLYTFDAWIDRRGNVSHWVTGQKQRQFPINFGSSTFIRQKYVPEIVEIGTKFLTAVGYRGFAEIEFKQDARDGRFYLIEVNVRITNFNAMLAKVGFNVPLVWYRELTGQPIGSLALEEDTGWHFWYSYEDFRAITNYLAQGQLTLGQIIRSLFVKKVGAIWDWQDIMPGLKAIQLYSSKLFKRFK
jgi:predicted ATP-grasp superfamily ATP-dependent carboligase